MSSSAQAALLDVLRTIRDPRSGRDIVSAGLVEGVESRDGLVQAALRADRTTARAMEGVRRAAEAALAQAPGVRNATVVLTSHREGAPADPPPRPGPAKPGERPKLLGDVRHVIAVASGKGGVGKSTTAVNLAVALGHQGLQVGLLDADVYGPSLPRMLGADAKPEVVDGRMQPLHAWGIRALSIGNMVDPEQAMIWRGPMVMGALEQMMGQADWGALDVLVVDMPPGTGDAQLTMAQRVDLAGAVIVSTPQDVALADARRGVAMFRQVKVPVLGLIENMSVFCCPNCGHRAELFGHGGVRVEAERLGVGFLGEVPLLLAIRETSDAGTPIVASQPGSEAAAAYVAIAHAVRARLG